MNERRGSLGLMLEAAGSVGRRPGLWATAIGSYRSLVPRHWWRRRPFLPVPDSDWLHFRLVTAYGGDGAIGGVGGGPAEGIRSTDLIQWLEWRKTLPG